MGYKGEDLDLRTPPASSTMPAEFARPPESATLEGPRSRPPFVAGRSGEPIWVDEAVLACCNHAFDIALAHRSAEVGLEHLALALTGNERAAEALERRAIRTAVLRRASATLIASEVPLGPPNGLGAPRRSEELAQVLRRAAAHAYRRRAPAGVDDILHVMLDVAPDLPGLALLRPALLPGSGGDTDQDSPIMRSTLGTEMAAPPRAPLPPYASSEPQRASQSQAFAGGPDSRLNSLEQMLRALSGEIAAERKILTGALQDLQRKIIMERANKPSGAGNDRLQPPLADRLQVLEHSLLHPKPTSVSESGSIHERGSALERVLLAGLGEVGSAIDDLVQKVSVLEGKGPAADTGVIAGRLDILEEAMGALSGAIDRQRDEIAARIVAPLTDRLDGLAGALESRDAEARDLDGLGERLAALERSLGEHVSRTEEKHASYAEDLGEVHEALVKLNANQHTLAESIGAWREQSAAALANAATRLEALSAATEEMHKLAVERHYLRNRFRYWLFGTNDWIAASWPAQSARIGEAMKSVKAALKR